MNKDMQDILVAIMEEHPELFYDLSELDDMDNGEVTQQTIDKWNEWIEEHMKKG